MVNRILNVFIAILLSFVLIGCGDKPPTVDDLNNFVGDQTELKLLTANLIKTTPIDADTNKYDFKGTYSYPNNMYEHVINIGNISIFRYMSGSEPHSFEGYIVAGKNKEGWFLKQKYLPFFDKSKQFNTQNLINKLTGTGGVKNHPVLGKVLFIDHEFPQQIDKLIDEYEKAIPVINAMVTQSDLLKKQIYNIKVKINTERSQEISKINNAYLNAKEEIKRNHYANFKDVLKSKTDSIKEERNLIVKRLNKIDSVVKKDWEQFPELKIEYTQAYEKRLELEKENDKIRKQIIDDYSDRFDEKISLLKNKLDEDKQQYNEKFEKLSIDEMRPLKNELETIKQKLVFIKDKTDMFNNGSKGCEIIRTDQCNRLKELDKLINFNY